MKREHVKRRSGRRREQASSRVVSDAALKDVSGGGLSLNYGHVEWKYTPDKVEAQGENIKRTS
jgi:hypothetical protein